MSLEIQFYHEFLGALNTAVPTIRYLSMFFSFIFQGKTLLVFSFIPALLTHMG